MTERIGARWRHLEACRKHGSVVTITVLDRADRTVVIVRDDGASPIGVEHSSRKAHTALTYDMPSVNTASARQRGSGSAGPLHLANITTAAGGLPMRSELRWSAPSVPGTPGAKGGGAADEGMRASRHRPNRQRLDWQLTNYGGTRGRGRLKWFRPFYLGLPRKFQRSR